MKFKSFVIIIILFLFPFCSLYQPPKSKEETFIKTNIPNPSNKTIVIFGFSSPSYAPQIGTTVSRIFHQELLKRQTIKKVVLKENTRWLMEGDEEESIKNAINLANKMGFDLVLLGWVDKVVYGKLTNLEIILRIRVISIKDKKTLFYSYKREVKESKDLSYPLDAKLSLQTPYLEDVIREMANSLISKMLSDNKVKNFLRLWEKRK